MSRMCASWNNTYTNTAPVATFEHGPEPYERAIALLRSNPYSSQRTNVTFLPEEDLAIATFTMSFEGAVHAKSSGIQGALDH